MKKHSLPFRVIAHPCAYFAYIRAYTRVSWRRSFGDSAHPRSLRTPPPGTAYYMHAFLQVSFLVLYNGPSLDLLSPVA